MPHYCNDYNSNNNNDSGSFVSADHHQFLLLLQIRGNILRECCSCDVVDDT